MAEDRNILQVTKDLRAAVCAILQDYGDGLGPVTDTSAELHRLCGCLERLLQFDQREQKSFLGPRKDYWDFVLAALQRQRGDTEPIHFVSTQGKLKSSLGKGRAFIRFCLAHGQLAESLQLCLLNPELTREWYGPRSPLLCPELQEDILDSLYALNGVTFDLDLQRSDLDGAWPMFSESRCSNSHPIQRRRPRKAKKGHQEVQLEASCPQEIPATLGDPQGVPPEEPHTSHASHPRDAARDVPLAGPPRARPPGMLPLILEKKREDTGGLSFPHTTWEPEQGELALDQGEGVTVAEVFPECSAASIQVQAEGIGTLPGAEGGRVTQGTPEGEAERGPVQRLLVSDPRGSAEQATSGSKQKREGLREEEAGVLPRWAAQEDSTAEKEPEQIEVTSVAWRAAQPEESLHAVVQRLQHQLQQAQEQAQAQEQLLKEQEGELQALQEQLHRCCEEGSRLRAEQEQKQQEAERRAARFEEELGEQRDLVRALKRRVMELIQEKDHLWQKLQHMSAMAPGCCVGCSKIFGRLSRRYPCRLCGGLVCHACSGDYRRRECRCPPCAQEVDAHVT
ncbi:RUN and FYVE domain-containing protein 4 isoform X1 [Ochotona curzoniae]|uniref:RUN and FYVE domain-containing protein 4 isoform X1 n=1 Tax=Ochotona curzoniae TaxID=130825 RepID=UPI001B34E20B|nr:RUN and FYVE domain-containing protein 4 isoform X1 [Ochotona curzoniae]XP_040842427.1 RUN and FYVE domain-containing protein 4 isoform X1 [Ochotona curzoniae]